MAIVRWSPARELANMQQQMDRLFTGYGMPDWSAGREGTFFPPVDVVETQDEYVVRADMPGMNPNDIRVHLVNNVLTIKGEKRYEHKEEEEGSYLHSERGYGTFERSFTLGSPIQPDAIRARYVDGVLEVHVSKSEQQKLKEIKVEHSFSNATTK